MLTTFNALFPILAVLLLGNLIRRKNWVAPNFWVSAERLAYFVLMPALLINAISSKQAGDLELGRLFVLIECTLVLVSLGMLCVYRFASFNAATFTSIFQGGVRFNNFIALAVIEGLLGSEALGIASVASGFLIVTMNILCVSLFAWLLPQQKFSLFTVVKQLFTNPFILACLVGALINVSGFSLPTAPSKALEMLAQAAIPISLLTVGASLQIKAIRCAGLPTVIASSFQFIAKPVIAFTMANFLGLSLLETQTAVLIFSVPTAASAYILAKQLGGDAEAMSAIITLQTLLAFVVIPIVSAWIIHAP